MSTTNQPDLYTSSFFKYTGEGRISIARSAPRNMSGFKLYRPLNPGDWFNSVSYEEYVARYYNEILKPLNPEKVFRDLQELAEGAVPVALCWEALDLTKKPNEFCHRTMVGEWLTETLGILVVEWPLPEKAKLVKADEQGALF